jgi:hypothetical protein
MPGAVFDCLVSLAPAALVGGFIAGHFQGDVPDMLA